MMLKKYLSGRKPFFLLKQTVFNFKAKKSLEHAAGFHEDHHHKKANSEGNEVIEDPRSQPDHSFLKPKLRNIYFNLKSKMEKQLFIEKHFAKIEAARARAIAKYNRSA